MNRLFKVGDWVSGTSFHDERLIGYIESIQHQTGNVAVRVVESDHKKAVGKLIKSDFRRLRKLSMDPLQAPGHIMNLIDIALTNRDQEWFLELTTKLKQIQHKTRTQKHLPSLPTHRWNKYEIQ